MTVAVSGLSLIIGTVIGFIWGIVRALRIQIAKVAIGCWVDIISGTPFLVQIFIVLLLCPSSGFNWRRFQLR
jgi:polar amino acid transport system permease protein